MNLAPTFRLLALLALVPTVGCIDDGQADEDLSSVSQGLSSDRPAHGGSGGYAFHDNFPSDRIVGFTVWSGAFVDGIEVIYQAPDGGQFSIHHGGYGGTAENFFLDAGEVVTGIRGASGKYLDAVQFMTNTRTSPLFGGDPYYSFWALPAPQQYIDMIPSGSRLTGFYGRSGDYIDQLGMVTTSSLIKVATPLGIE